MDFKTINGNNTTYTDDMAYNAALIHIEDLLMMHNLDCSRVGLPMPIPDANIDVNDQYVIDPVTERGEYSRLYPTLNEQQKEAFDAIVLALENNY